MTHNDSTSGAPSAMTRDAAPGAESVLDVETLAADLFTKLAAAQLDLLRARTAGDRRAADTHLMCLRGSALLLACLPIHPDGRGYGLKVLAATVLREEDGATGSHAWLMAERALLLDQQRPTKP